MLAYRMKKTPSEIRDMPERDRDDLLTLLWIQAEEQSGDQDLEE